MRQRRNKNKRGNLKSFMRERSMYFGDGNWICTIYTIFIFLGKARQPKPVPTLSPYVKIFAQDWGKTGQGGQEIFANLASNLGWCKAYNLIDQIFHHNQLDLGKWYSSILSISSITQKSTFHKILGVYNSEFSRSWFCGFSFRRKGFPHL